MKDFIKESTLLVITIAILIGGGYFLGRLALSVQDQKAVAECLHWKSQSQEFKDYYFTTWQIEQCEFHNIEL